MAINELPEVANIFYYPTLRYYPRDSKYRPYDYDANLSLEDIVRFAKRVHSEQVVLVEDYSFIGEDLLKNTEGPSAARSGDL
jgi:hypothetical protein